jgi:PTH1 family peptidyl-tRNA hydrolase
MAIAIVGLGNPGRRYRDTRHNLGFMVAAQLGARWKFGWTAGKGPYEIAAGRIPGCDEDLLLVAPTTYMNAIGEAVTDVMARFDVPLASVLVMVDDFWLPLGTIRFRKSGSDGGHNGLGSIIGSVNSEEFPRLRLGIQTPSMPPKDEIVDFVLGEFEAGERAMVSDMIARAADAIEDFCRTGRAVPVNPPKAAEPGEGLERQDI